MAKPEPIRVEIPLSYGPARQDWLYAAIVAGDLAKCKELIENGGCNVHVGRHDVESVSPLHTVLAAATMTYAST